MPLGAISKVLEKRESIVSVTSCKVCFVLGLCFLVKVFMSFILIFCLVSVLAMCSLSLCVMFSFVYRLVQDELH